MRPIGSLRSLSSFRAAAPQAGCRPALRLVILLAGAVAAAGAPATAAADFPLVSGGQAAPLLVDPTEAEQPQLRQALNDLRTFVRDATGARPRILTTGSLPSGPAVLIGRIAGAAGIEPSEEEVGFDGYLIDVTANRLSLAGPNPAATANAIYDLCESTIGVRFHAPGPDGIFVPELTVLSVPLGRRQERPAFAHRQAWYNGNVLAGASNEAQEELRLFALRNRAGGIDAVIRHYFSDLVPPSTYFDEDPEFFAEVHGQRVADGQLCTSHPYVRHLTVEHWIERFTREPGLRIGSLSPNDGERFCSCETCRRESPDLTTRLVMFMNDVTRRITAEHPDRYLSFYAYASLVEPPYQQGLRLHPRLIPTVARYSVCQVHTLADGECRSIVNFRRQLEGWAAISDQIMIREYAAWWPVPDLTFEVMADNIRTYRSLGAIGISREYLRRGFMSDILMAIDLHLQWNPETDPDELLAELLRARFGAAAGEMQRALGQLRQVLDELPTTAVVIGDEQSGAELYRPALLRSVIERLDSLAATQSGRVRRRVAEEADLLRMALAEVEALKAIHRYKWSGRGADRQAAVDQLARASDLARQLELRGRLGANTLANLEGKSAELTSAGLIEPISGAFDYRDDMARGGFSRRDADHVDGYYPGVYGLALLPRKIGQVSYTLTAAPGKRFVRAEIYDLVFKGSDTRITVRANGFVHPVAEGITLDDRDLVQDLSPIVAGTDRFTVIFWAQNNTSNPILCLDNWGIRGEAE